MCDWGGGPNEIANYYYQPGQFPRCGKRVPLIFKWPENPLGEDSSVATCVRPKGHHGDHKVK